MTQTALYKVINPATGKTEKTYPTASQQDIEKTLQQANKAYQSWRLTSIEARSQLLNDIADKYIQYTDKLAAIVTREMGKPIAQAKGEIAFVADIFRYYAKNAPALLQPDIIDDVIKGSARVEKHPIGVLFAIMPWNYPHYQVARLVAPNLMAANTIILKHAPQCPETAEAIKALFLEAGAPLGIYNNTFATNKQAADIINNVIVQGVSLTGSETAGQAVAQTASGALKKVVLELGGSDAFIVLEDADIKQAVTHAIEGRFDNAGQACNAAKRIIVVEAIFNDFVTAFVQAVKKLTPSNPMHSNTYLGPLSSVEAAVGLQQKLDDAINHGAKVLLAGGYIKDKPGAWFKPVILTEVTESMRAYKEELFGPVAVVYKAQNLQEAIRIANDVPYGLGAAIHTHNQDYIKEAIDNLQVGMVTINAASASDVNTPFGGVKRSGFGRELGKQGITEFLNYKLVRDRS